MTHDTEAAIPKPHRSETSSPFGLKLNKDMFQKVEFSDDSKSLKIGRKYPISVDKTSISIVL
jgi:hypothetical protein